VEGLEHTVQGPPHAVAITPDGKVALVAAPTRYDYDGKKEILDNFLQVVELDATPPRLTAKVDVGAHTNGLSINRAGTLLLAAGHDGTVKVLATEGWSLRLLNQVKLGETRLSGISFTPDGKARSWPCATRTAPRCSPSTARPSALRRRGLSQASIRTRSMSRATAASA
jgi:DNA-binding beta-propeller fold protein YncE